MATRSSKPAHRAAAIAAGLIWSSGALAVLDIPDTPLFLTSTGLAPNIVLTLDDSGSMARAFTPDLCGNPNGICDNNPDKRLDHRYVKSSDFNPLYYNPEITYAIPTDANGAPVSNPSFSAAYINGFDPARGTLNLGTEYRPNAGLFLSRSNESGVYEEFMRHYVDDVRCTVKGKSSRCQLDSTAGTGAANWIDMPNPVKSCKDERVCEKEEGPAYYYKYNKDNTNCNRKSDYNCYYELKIVGQQPGPADLDGDGDIDGHDEQQNFANWYSFYRTRNLATVSATALAFGTLPESTRVAWQALNSCRGSDTTLVTKSCSGWTGSPAVSNAIKPFSEEHRSNFFTWLFRLKTNTSTPLPHAMERAGKYFSSTGAGSPYDNDLNRPGSAGEYSCRKNYHIMMTDGIWNVAITGIGNIDNASRTLPDKISYTPRPPYKDGNSNSLADIAFKYWITDLRSDLANNVPSYITDFSGEGEERYFNPKNDPASWQHMVNFTVGFGLTPFITRSGLTWGKNMYEGSYDELRRGVKSWPSASSSGPDGNVADLWHAAINSRGKFFSAEKPDDLVDAFQRIVDTITTQATAGGGAGLSSNTSQIDQAGALVFEAKFNADWSGQLLARSVGDDLNLDATLWDAGQRIPPPHTRRIFALNGTPQALGPACPGGPLGDALDLTVSGDPDGRCAQRVNWLRGDGRVEGVTWSRDAKTGVVTASYRLRDHGFVAGDKVTVSDVKVSEDPAPATSLNGDLEITEVTPDSISAVIASAGPDPGTYASGGRVRYTDLRDRPISVLGDIMNADPVFSFGGDLGFGTSDIEGSDDYADYATGKNSEPPVLYVGANDGMLHAFCAGDPKNPCPDGVASGEELFAFIPQGVYENLSALSDPQYSHRYYVDGQLSVSDAYLSGAWGTYLVGALGAGGRSIYALDVTNPANFKKGDIKWEFSDADDLGLTFSKPQIAPITNETWGVIFGNGYNSDQDTAVLYVLDLANGREIAKISTSATLNNGLSTPYLYDSDGDRIVDVVYAGDLQGNLWKFVNSTGTWTLGNAGQPLFTARSAGNEVQPITVQPAVAPHPNGGVLVYFGTGSYLTRCDIGDPDGCDGRFDHQQAFYAIWDKPGVTGTVARNELEPYSILQQTVAQGYTVRTTSAATIDWGNDRGWYLDLPAIPGLPAERIVSPALIMQFANPTVPDRILFVTNTPSQDPCTMGGTSWLMELDLITGGHPRGPVFDLDGSGTFDERDQVAGQPPSGVALDAAYGITGEPLLFRTESGNIVKAFSGTTGKSGTDASPLQRGEPPTVGAPPKRLYWRQIL